MKIGRLGSLLTTLALLAGGGCSDGTSSKADGGLGPGGSGGAGGADGGAAGHDDAGGGGVDAGAASIGATATQAAAFCQAKCDAFQRCAGTGGPTCVTNCTTSGGDPAAMRADALALGASCWQTVSCSNPESCAATVMTALDPNFEQDSVFSACLAKMDACSGIMSKDRCPDAMLATLATRAKLTACFDGACDALEGCFDAAFGMPSQ